MQTMLDDTGLAIEPYSSCTVVRWADGVARPVRVAEEAGLTLIGFVRGDRCNVYAHAQRMQA